MVKMDIPATTPDQITSTRALAISYQTLHTTLTIHNVENNTNITVPFSSYMSKYKDFLSTIVQEIPLTAEEQDLYMYKPKMLSVDLYGITELWSDLLVLNNAFSIKDFKPVKLKAYDPFRIKAMINEILILEANNLESW